MIKKYYRRISKNNFNKIMDGYKNNPNTIELFPVVSEFSCKGNQLSVFESNGEVENDLICETSIVFLSLSFENFYIVLDENDFISTGIDSPIKGECSIGYTKGENMHRNIPNLTINSIAPLIRIFASKERKSIDKKKGKELLLRAFKESNISEDNLKPLFYVKLLMALNNDNLVYPPDERRCLISELQSLVQKQYNDMTNEFVTEASNQYKSVLK